MFALRIREFELTRTARHTITQAFAYFRAIHDFASPFHLERNKFTERFIYLISKENFRLIRLMLKKLNLIRILFTAIVNGSRAVGRLAVGQAARNAIVFHHSNWFDVHC